MKDYTHLIVDYYASLLEAIKQMDRLDRKLLMVYKGSAFYSLISIGDIQRAIIKNYDLSEILGEVLRSSVKVAHESDNIDYIKQMMLKYRTEFMPVLDNDNKLIQLYFWEDIFDTSLEIKYGGLRGVPVVIMAGGKGTRLRPITNIIPKPLVPLGEKPVIEIIADNFNKMGVTDFYFSVNYKAEMIKDYFEKVTGKDYNIKYFHEEKPLGTAGSLYMLKETINSTFFVSNCDIIINQDYEEVYNYHKSNGNELTLVSALKHYHIPYGTIEIQENGILKDIKEKPDLTFQINAGMYVIEPHLLNEIPENKFFHITELIDKIRKRNGRIGVFPVSERSWFDIGEWKEYQNTLMQYENNEPKIL